nr:hypothetical protein [Tanacetum cinerariifolium]
MDTTKAQQIALDDALVAPTNCLKIGKFNHRLRSTLKSNESTLQAVLDALKLTPFYNAFQITTNVPKIYMSEFWATVSIHHTLLRFKMNGKSHTLNLENFRDMLPICPKLPDYFISKDQSISRRNKMFWHTTRDDPMFNTIRVISRHQDTHIYGDILTDNLQKKKTKYKKKADEPVTSSKTKTVPVSKGSRLKSSAKVATKRSKKDFHMSHVSGSGNGVDIQSKVYDEQQQKETGTNEGASVRPEDDEETDVNYDSEETESGNDGDDLTHPNLSTYKEDDEEEEKEKADDDEVSYDHRVYTPPDHQLTDEEENQEGDDEVKEGEEEQEEEEELYRDLNINLHRIAALLSEFKLKKILIDKMEENQSVNRSDIQKNLYNALVESYNSDKDIFSSYGDIVTLKRGRDDQDKDEDPSTGSNRVSKRRRSGKEAESSKELTHKESKSTNSLKDASRSQPKSSGKSAHAEEHGQKVDDLEDQSHQEFNTGNDDETSFLATPIDFSAFIMNRLKIDNLTQEVLTGSTYDLIKGACKSIVELEYHLEEVFKAANDRLDWHNLEEKPYPYDLSKPLPLIQNECGHQVIPWDYFINNDLEYLKGGSLSKKYTTSITKTKAADYGQVKWIEGKVSRIWNPKKVVYDKHAYWETYHYGSKRQRLYEYASNMESLYDVYSRYRIIAVTRLKIMEWFGYSHLKEIIVRRQDDKLYNFRE